MKRFARGMVAGLLVGLPLLVSPPARADFNPVYDAALSTPATGKYVYDAVFLTGPGDNGMAAQILAPYAGARPPGATSTGAPGEGSFLTIYDIPNASTITLGGTNASQFAFFTQTTGTTPPGVTPIPPDSTLTNVTVIYNGPTLPLPPSVMGTTFTGLIQIQLASTAGISFNPNSPNGAFSNQDEFGPGNPTLQGTIVAGRGMIPIPTLGAAAVPEPASVVMMSFGGLGVGALALFFRRKASV